MASISLDNGLVFAHCVSFCCIRHAVFIVSYISIVSIAILFTLMCMKEEIARRMATEFQGDVTQESLLQVLDGGIELAGDAQALAPPGIAVL